MPDIDGWLAAAAAHVPLPCNLAACSLALCDVQLLVELAQLSCDSQEDYQDSVTLAFMQRQHGICVEQLYCL